MNPLKRLAGQTAIYGLPSIIGRILGYLLVPIYTRIFSEAAYGTVTVFYSYAAFLMVILTYGMETAYFRFAEKEQEPMKVYRSAMTVLGITTLLFLLPALFFSGTVASWIDYPAHPEYIVWFAIILGLDALTAIPFARLRAENKARRFAAIRMLNILVNIGLNLFFLVFCPWIMSEFPASGIADVVQVVYSPSIGIGYIFISNLASSAITLVALLPQLQDVRPEVHPSLLKKMLLYAFPLLFAGMAGIVNETFDRILLRYLLPEGIAEQEVGIYGACYKISILMTLFIQAYRYAAEPFFFSHAKHADAKQLFARLMNYFVILVAFIFLVTMLYLDDIFIYFIGPAFREGRQVIPILMMANLFLGIYFNLSIWYKLTGKTIYGAWLSLIGAVVTIALNVYWIPRSPDHLIHGYLGAAWATFCCYGLTMVLSYLWGQKYYPVKYDLVRFFGYLGMATGIYLITVWLNLETSFSRIIIHTVLLLIFAGIVWMFERKSMKQLVTELKQ